MSAILAQYLSIHDYFILMSLFIEATIIICAYFVVIKHRNTFYRHEKTAESVYDVQLAIRDDLRRIADILVKRERDDKQGVD